MTAPVSTVCWGKERSTTARRSRGTEREAAKQQRVKYQTDGNLIRAAQRAARPRGEEGSGAAHGGSAAGRERTEPSGRLTAAPRRPRGFGAGRPAALSGHRGAWGPTAARPAHPAPSRPRRSEARGVPTTAPAANGRAPHLLPSPLRRPQRPKRGPRAAPGRALSRAAFPRATPRPHRPAHHRHGAAVRERGRAAASRTPPPSRRAPRAPSAPSRYGAAGARRAVPLRRGRDPHGAAAGEWRRRGSGLRAVLRGEAGRAGGSRSSPVAAQGAAAVHGAVLTAVQSCARGCRGARLRLRGRLTLRAPSHFGP